LGNTRLGNWHTETLCNRTCRTCESMRRLWGWFYTLQGTGREHRIFQGAACQDPGNPL
jgi:hypothetical protein